MAAVGRGRRAQVSDTIYAVSSGAPPAAIAVLRVSGNAEEVAAALLGGSPPRPRTATLRRLRDQEGMTLDHAIALWFPAPHSATGEDVLELHVHGGRAVVAAVEQAIGQVAGTRRADPGEFTRRALLAGRIDLGQAAGLADLLQAETETERRLALAATEGALAREIGAWLAHLSEVRAHVEAAIDHEEEHALELRGEAADAALDTLLADLDRRLAAPTSERLREGWRVVLAGPPNAGKSSLFNAMLGREAAIVSALPGTTRDLIEARVLRDGHVFTLIDTAGLAEWTDDPIEAEGIRRSRVALEWADLVLWLADAAPPSEARSTLWLRPRCDLGGATDVRRVPVSAVAPDTVDRLWSEMIGALETRLRAVEGYVLQDRQRAALWRARERLGEAAAATDLLIRADHLRSAAALLAGLLGVDAGEALLDALFSRFCVGK